MMSIDDPSPAPPSQEAPLAAEAELPAQPRVAPKKTIVPKPREATDETDVFLLEQVFPEAHAAFGIGSQPDAQRDCIVALDTNVLLLPYTVRQDDLSQLHDVYRRIAGENRLFIPERVAREFIKNRDGKLGELVKAIGDMKSRMSVSDARISPILRGLAESEDLAKAGEGIAAGKKAFVKALDGLASQIRSWRGNDPLTSFYAGLFTTERMVHPAENHAALLLEWRDRAQNRIPPGYKDATKPDSGVGDFIIWKSLLSLGATHRKDMIFVTGEEKGDWFVRSSGERLYPRPELVDEYRRLSGGRMLRLSSLHELLGEMSAPAKLVNDVRDAEHVANTAVIRASAPLKFAPVVSSSHTNVSVGHREFDYSTHDGKVRIEGGGHGFDLAFSKSSDTSIQLLKRGATKRIARVRNAGIDVPTSMERYDTSSTSYTIQLNEGFLVENDIGAILAGRIVAVQDDTRGAANDLVVFAYTISDPATRVILP